MKILRKSGVTGSIKKGSVYYFCDDSLVSNDPHYFVVLNTDPLKDPIIVLVCITSQVAKTKRIIKALGFPDNTGVDILPSDYPELTKPSIVNCNSVFEMTLKYINNKSIAGKFMECSNLIPRDILIKLIDGVLKSSRPSQDVRNILLGI